MAIHTSFNLIYSIMTNLWSYIKPAIKWSWHHIDSSFRFLWNNKISVIVILLPILCYVFRFGSNGLSNDTEKWSQFGDYIGGTYSVILSILVIYIARNLTRKDEASNRRKNAIDEIFKQIIKIESLTSGPQKASAANKLLRLTHEHQLHISEGLCQDMENLANYYIRISNNAPINIAYENSMKEKLKDEYDGN